jgi:hypothetical protein
VTIDVLSYTEVPWFAGKVMARWRGGEAAP